eukprot:gnl/TRDRNA2_/TRDRNA2_193782_c0_seq1.p1 gnl/TRDRNA2_/TRDRNA2_193782_c0~~gnl/TRDRNA2_/TRDRNA2_193782_c0_seq1.p1  ORF type:complete len:120 (-),score=6.22 gnl/TRDRNA2_/TRDRNA2_193782_c0_seq1:147-506(-)
MTRLLVQVCLVLAIFSCCSQAIRIDRQKDKPTNSQETLQQSHVAGLLSRASWSSAMETGWFFLKRLWAFKWFRNHWLVTMLTGSWCDAPPCGPWGKSPLKSFFGSASDWYKSMNSLSFR